MSFVNPYIVERVGARHAIRNAVFMFCTMGLLTLVPVMLLVAGILATIYGLFTAKWDTFGLGLLIAVLMAPLTVIGAVFYLFVFWLSLLFMPCTPAYVCLWLVAGIPFSIVGAISGAAPTATVIVIIIK